MAFTAASLTKMGDSMVSAGVVQNCYFYATADAAATVVAAGYFNAARNTLRKGDVILAAQVINGTPAYTTYILTAVPATGNVTAA
jgi:hypothetical protein